MKTIAFEMYGISFQLRYFSSRKKYSIEEFGRYKQKQWRIKIFNLSILLKLDNETNNTWTIQNCIHNFTGWKTESNFILARCLHRMHTVSDADIDRTTITVMCANCPIFILFICIFTSFFAKSLSRFLCSISFCS